LVVEPARLGVGAQGGGGEEERREEEARDAHGDHERRRSQTRCWSEPGGTLHGSSGSVTTWRTGPRAVCSNTAGRPAGSSPRTRTIVPCCRICPPMAPRPFDVTQGSAQP